MVCDAARFSLLQFLSLQSVCARGLACSFRKTIVKGHGVLGVQGGLGKEEMNEQPINC